MPFKVAAIRITDWLVQGGSVPEEDREIYEFGMDKLLTSLTNFVLTVIAGALIGIPLHTGVFYIAYYFLRVYAGGYHAETPGRCFFLSIGVVIPILAAIRFYPVWHTDLAFYVLLGISLAVLLKIAPVENKNKILDEIEKVVYRGRMLRNLGIMSITAVMLQIFSLHGYAASVLCGILLAMLMAVAGKVKLMAENRIAE